MELKVIAFDADDTLWINETYFDGNRAKILWFDGRLFVTPRISKELFKVEIDNLIIRLRNQRLYSFYDRSGDDYFEQYHSD
jgi:hypothetical protein